MIWTYYTYRNGVECARICVIQWFFNFELIPCIYYLIAKHSIYCVYLHNVGIARINNPFLVVYTTHVWWLWFVIALPTVHTKSRGLVWIYTSWDLYIDRRIWYWGGNRNIFEYVCDMIWSVIRNMKHAWRWWDKTTKSIWLKDYEYHSISENPTYWV